MHLHIVIPLVVVIAFQTPQEDGNVEMKRKFLRLLCQRNDRKLLQELDACHQKENDAVKEAIISCNKLIAPETGGQVAAFIEVLCRDPSKYDEYEACYEVYKSSGSRKDEMTLSNEAKECYAKFIESNNFRQEMES